MNATALDWIIQINGKQAIRRFGFTSFEFSAYRRWKIAESMILTLTILRLSTEKHRFGFTSFEFSAYRRWKIAESMILTLTILRLSTEKHMLQSGLNACMYGKTKGSKKELQKLEKVPASQSSYTIIGLS